MALGDSEEVNKLQQELKQVRHNLFSAKTPRTKRKYRDEDERLRKAIAAELKQSGWQSDAADKLAAWDPYDQNASAPYFDPEWMFGLKGFDIVIGNPPYGVKFPKNYASRLKQLYSTYSLRGESYVLFIERAIQILKTGANLSLIVPDTYLNLGFTLPLREYLLRNSKLRQIFGLPSGVFSSAVVDTTLLFLEKNGDGSESEHILLNRLSKKDSVGGSLNPEFSFEVPVSDWAKKKLFNILASPSDLKILEFFENDMERVRKHAEIFSGIKAYEVGKGNPPQTNDVRRSKPYTATSPISPTWKPFYEGKHVERYQSLWKSNSYISYGNWLAAPRKPANFKGKKLFIRKIVGKTLLGFFSKEDCFCNTLLFVIKCKKHSSFDEAALLAFINSKPMGWYFRKHFQISDEDIFPQIMARDIEFLPIPALEKNRCNLFNKLVNLIQFARSEDKNAAYLFLDDLIDACVMECYFRDHMAERDLLFIDELAPSLDGYDPNASESQQRAFLEQFGATHNAPKAKVRNKLLRLTADSPDLLAVIKNEGSS